MGLTLTIAGIDVLDYLDLGPGNPGLDRALQARSVMRFTLKDRSGAYRPDLRQEVIAAIDGARIFGGVVTFIDEGDWGDYRGNWMQVEAGDWSSLLETTLFNGIALGTTLRDLVQHIVTALLAPRGFSIHPSMAAGPVIGPQGYSFKYVSEIFSELARISAWPWAVDEFKRIIFAPADGRPAPFALTATNDTINTIKIASSIDGYVNLVWLHYGAAGVREVTDQWTATAGQTEFTIEEFPNPEGVVSPPTIATVNGIDEAVGAGELWTWRASDGTLLRSASAPLAGGEAISATYTANFPAAIYEVLPEIATYGEASLLQTADDVFDVRQARQIAQGILRERGGFLRRLNAITHTPGIVPGHIVSVDVPERAIAEECLCLSSRLVFDGRKADGDDFWRFDLELVEGAAYTETWQKFFRDITRQSSGAAVSASGSVGPTPPSSGGSGGSATPLPSTVYRYLGGSRTVASFVPAAAADPWQTIAGSVEAFVDFDALGGLVVQVSVQCRSRAAGVFVTPRVVTVDGAGNRAEVIATGSATDATAWTYQAMPLPPRTGLMPIRVELTASVRDRDVFVANAMLDGFDFSSARARTAAARTFQAA